MTRRTTLRSTSNNSTTLPEIDMDTAITRFIDEQTVKNRTSRTLEWYGENLHTLQAFLERQNIITSPSSITEKVLKTHYILYMLQTLGLSPVTVNGRIRTLKSFFRYLRDEGYVRDSPAEALTMLATEKTIIQTFSDSDVRKLLSAPDINTFAGFRDYVIMCLLLETGVRLKEIVEIRLGDIRWNEPGIVVNGKGRKQRLIPFQTKMRRLLQRYIEFRGDVPGVDHLLITVDNVPLSRRSLQERIEDHGKTAKLVGVRVSPHTFRHTFAKLYIKNGGDAFSLQAILGHTTLDMVRHYVNLFSSEVVDQHRKFSPLEHIDGNVTGRR